MHQDNKLLHSNIATNHMAVIHSRCLRKYEHWSTANSLNRRFKQAWQKCKKYQVTDLVKITSQEFNIRKQCLEQDINMLQEHIMANQGMAWSYSKHTTKVPYWPKPKGIRKYNGNHVNIAIIVNRFRLGEISGHGKTDSCWHVNKLD